MTASARTTVDDAEIRNFSAMAAEWWAPRGKFRPLHAINPVRIGWIKQVVCDRFGRDPKSATAFDGLRVLDIGCGGGLLTEPLARLGAEAVGADASAVNIEVAKAHAAETGVAIDYRATTAEALADAGERFDVVFAMEIVEHVADVDLFVSACATMVKPGGLLVMSTLNRTMKAFALAIVGAEYVLRWLPPGTHQWSKFVRPAELAQAMRAAGLDPVEETGVRYDPLTDRWSADPRDMDVNYMMVAVRAGA